MWDFNDCLDCCSLSGMRSSGNCFGTMKFQGYWLLYQIQDMSVWVNLQVIIALCSFICIRSLVQVQSLLNSINIGWNAKVTRILLLLAGTLKFKVILYTGWFRNWRIPKLYADEIKKAVFQLHLDKAPRPDRFSATFYQNKWEVVGAEVTKAIVHFFFQILYDATWD